MKLLPLLALLIAGSAFGQTKLIAHKSHSGSVTDFAAAYEESLFDREDSDFGLPPTRYVNQVDSVIYVSDSVAVLIRTKGHEFLYGDKETKPWRMEKIRDTLRHHPLLQNRHALDSIKKAWSENFESSNPVDQIRFIGFDNKKPRVQKGKRSAIPVVLNRSDKPSNTGGLLIGLVLFSTLAALLVHLRQRSHQQPALPA